MAIKLLLLVLTFFAITPNLGFFTIPAFFTLFFIILIMLTTLLKPNFFNTFFIKPSDELVKLTLLGLLFYSGIYYGGLYQKPESFFIGYLLFFATLFYVSYCIFTKRKLSLLVILSSYLLIALWTIFSSPHPIVDTIVVLKEASLKFFAGLNPYTSTYTKVYENINPNYYNYLPFSFIFFLPFVLIFNDPRFGIIFCNILSAIFIYRIFKENNNKNILLLFIYSFLFFPRSFYMLEHVYLDTVIFSFFLGFYYFYSNKKYLLAFLTLSLFFSFKQPMILALPIMLTNVNFRKKILERQNLLIFVIPLFLPLYYLLLNKTAFLNNIIFNLNLNKITSPINGSLTIQTFLKNFIFFTSTTSIYFTLIFTIIFLIIIRSKIPTIQKFTLTYFTFNFFMYHAFFNSYYFYVEFLFFSMILDFFNFKNNRHSKIKKMLFYNS